jgi:hypothetical protein
MWDRISFARAPLGGCGAADIGAVVPHLDLSRSAPCSVETESRLQTECAAPHDSQDPGPVLLRYHMKFRFWFQEFSPAPKASKVGPTHYDLPRYYYQTEGWAGEYDVPPAFRRAQDPQIPGYPNWPASSKGDMHLTPGSSCTGDCPDGPDCACIHTITYHWSMSNASMLYAGGHCHAPSCIGIELYKNDTGAPELICNQTTHYGVGGVKTDKYDEAGYVTLPPCLWGSDKEGLKGPVYLPPNTP